MYNQYEEMADCLLKKFKNTPKVVIALDEAHVLHEKTRNYLPVTVVLQTIKECSERYKREPVWVVFASTALTIFYYGSLRALCKRQHNTFGTTLSLYQS